MASQRYLGATPIWALRTIWRTEYSKPMEMFLDVRGDMSVMGKRSNESRSRL